MDRKLLPYEHQLIDTLGVTKEEYLAFVAIQQDYQDPKVGTALDIRNEPGTIALVLTIVGIIFQVGAALLAPRPKIPDLDDRNNRRTREARFAPTFGFNSAQELASYGDPVNLVYTNTTHNPNGGVRLSGALVWSAIESFGSTQFMRLLFVMGAAQILKIKPDFTAFGQVALQDFDPGLTWQFYKKDGAPTFNDIESGDLTYLPQRLHQGPDSTEVCRIIQSRAPNPAVGFSQCYTPTTSTSFGAYDPIPISVKMFTRDQGDGGIIDVLNKVKFRNQNYSGNNWFDSDRGFSVNDEIVLQLEKTQAVYDLDSGDDSDKAEQMGIQQVDNLLHQYAESMTFGSTYMFGTAKFILVSVSNNKDVDINNVEFTLKCIEPGREPFIQPQIDELTDRQTANVLPKKDFETALNQLTREDEEETPGLTGTQIVIKDNLLGININFSEFDEEGVQWIDIFGKQRYGNFNSRGSLDTSRDRLNDRTVVNPPTFRTRELKRKLRKQVVGLEKVIADIRADVYNDPDNLPSNANDEARHFSGLVKTVLFGGAVTLGGKTFQDKKLGLDSDSVRHKLSVFEERLITFKINKGSQSDIQTIKTQIRNARRRVARRESKAIGFVHNHFIDFYTYYAYDKSLGEPAVDAVWIDNQVPIRTVGTGDVSNFTFIAGLETLKESLEDNKIFNELLVDKTGIEAIEAKWKPMIRQKKKAIRDLKHVIDNYDRLINKLGPSGPLIAFFTKCLVKAETASYETVLPCDNVRFSLKTQLFRRISGRQREYAPDRVVENYSTGDNGIQERAAFFRISYKRVGDATYDEVPALFGVERGSTTHAYLGLYFEANDNKTKENRVRWQFKFEPVHDPMAWYEETQNTTIAYITGDGNYRTISHKQNNFGFYGTRKAGLDSRNYLVGLSRKGPADTFNFDMFSNTTDTQVQFSFENGPEFSIAAVSEQQLATGTDDEQGSKYSDLSTLALLVRAGKGVQDLRNITTFVEQGKRCFNADTFSRYSASDTSGSSSYAPDIFVDTVLDKENGVGNYVAEKTHVLDQQALKLSKAFCKNNNLPLQDSNKHIQLFMDGVIADQTSWREFWANTAPFSLLELVRKNGKEALLPAIPVDSAGKAANNDGTPITVSISALFTTGNIIEGSYKEEFVDYGQSTQPLIATVIYREMEAANEETSRTVFSRQNTVEVQRKDDGISEEAKSRETFDVTSYVTQREQAIMLGKLLVNQRAFNTRAVEFKTFPTDSPIEPGSYVYIDVGNKTWDRYSAGKVMDNGVLNAPIHDGVSDGTYDFLLYNHGTQNTVSLNGVSVSNMTASALSNYPGYMFVMGIQALTKRVFRITEVALDEEGEVTVKALEYPCYDNKGAKVADFRSSKFTVR